MDTHDSPKWFLVRGMCRIMVNQTMLLSGNKKLENRGYVNLTYNFLLAINYYYLSLKKIISRKLNLVSKLLGIILKKYKMIGQNFEF